MAGLSIEEYARSVGILETCGCNVKFSENGNNSARRIKYVFKLSPVYLLIIPYQLSKFQLSSLNAF